MAWVVAGPHPVDATLSPWLRLLDGVLPHRVDTHAIAATVAPTRRYGVLYIGPSIGEAVAVCVLFYVHFKLWSLSLLVFGAVGAYAIPVSYTHLTLPTILLV